MSRSDGCEGDLIHCFKLISITTKKTGTNDLDEGRKYTVMYKNI